MSAAVDVTTGATLTAGTSGWTAELTGINVSGVSRPAIDVTHLGSTTWREFVAGDLIDPGSIEIEGHLQPDDALDSIQDVAETWTIQFAASGGDGTGASWAASGFMTDFNTTGPLEDKMTFTATIKLTGAITDTAGSV